MNNPASESSMRAFMPALILLGAFIILLALLLPEPVVPPSGFATATQPPTVVAAVPTDLPPTEVVAALNPAAIVEGEGIFSAGCSACHGLNARGIPGLGKDLIESEFVHGLTDEELLHFIVTGRDTSDPLNTTGIPMPPSGGNPSLTDEQLLAVIAYLRSESGSTTIAQAVPVTAPPIEQGAPTATPAAPLPAPVLPTSIPVTPQPFSPETAYLWSCAGCHGVDGQGNAPFGEGIASSSLLADKSALMIFLIAAHPPTNPEEQFPHPPLGGYPALTEEQLSALSDYILSMISGDE
jgi:disulfide bond formation protein DsbB